MMNAFPVSNTSSRSRDEYFPCKMRVRLATLLAILTSFFGCAFGIARGGQVSLAWDANPEPNVAGYRLYYGTSPGNYTSFLDVGTATTATVTNLTDGVTYYFVVT